MVDRLHRIEPQSFRQRPRIDLVVAATFDAVVPGVADHYSLDQRLDHIVEPGGLVAFFKSEMDFTAKLLKKLSDRFGRGGNDGAKQEFAGRPFIYQLDSALRL
jgi:hypothetical protein